MRILSGGGALPLQAFLHEVARPAPIFKGDPTSSLVGASTSFLGTDRINKKKETKEENMKKEEEETEEGRRGKAILHEAVPPKRLSIVFRNGRAFIIYKRMGSKYGLLSGRWGPTSECLSS